MVAAASVQRQPGPANVQGDPTTSQGTDCSKVSKVTGRGRTVLDTLGHAYSLTMPLFRHTVQFWFGAYVLVVKYF